MKIAPAFCFLPNKYFLFVLYLNFLVSFNSLALEIYIPDASSPGGSAVLLDVENEGEGVIIKSRPVLFVHGHNANDVNDSNFNFERNWRQPEAEGPLTSFQATLNSSANSDLEIEPYFIRFRDQSRSIVDDAREIGEATGVILKRHDQNYQHCDPNSSTNVKLVIVAYSKGTISTRHYLKHLHEPCANITTPRSDFKPISEFIAIAPPNHGLRSLATIQLQGSFGIPIPSLSEMQLHNGYDKNCTQYDYQDASQSHNFIGALNGHEMTNNFQHPDPQNQYTTEASGSRDNMSPINDGILYTTIYYAGDFVGGSNSVGDCQGRKIAKNFAPDAVNFDLGGSGASSPIAAVGIHQDTIHEPQVICLSLYMAIHHKAPDNQNPCGSLQNGMPVIPLPEDSFSSWMEAFIAMIAAMIATIIAYLRKWWPFNNLGEQGFN